MKEKCLLLFPRPLFPLLSGYAKKSWNLVRILAEQYDLTVALTASGEISKEEKDYYISLGVKWISYCIPKWKSYLNCLLGLFSGKPLQVSYFYSRAFQQEINRLSGESNVLVSVLVRTREYLMGLEKDKTVVFDMTDSIGLNYEHSRSHTRSFFWKMIYGIEGKRLLSYEKKCIEESSVTYLLNRIEYDYWSPHGNVVLLPHGVNEILFTYKKRDPAIGKSAVFMGKMDYQPNVDAVLWYLKYVHPYVKDKVPLIIVGANPTKDVQEAAEKTDHVTVTGFVEDAYLYANSAMVLLAPMQTGGGIQNKVLEGMALGKVNAVTSLAAGPIIGAKSGKNLIIADKPEEYTKFLKDLFDHYGTGDANDLRYIEIGRAARELIRGRYTWEAYGRAFIKGIEESRR